MSIEQYVETEIREFSRYIFDKIIERIKIAGAPDKDYICPEINFAEPITPEEKEELDNLETKIKVAGVLNKEIKDEESARCNQLKQRIESDKGGFHNSHTGKIVLNTARFQEGIDYGLITHEILHSIRSQVLHYEERNIGYSLLEQIRYSAQLTNNTYYKTVSVVYIIPESIEFTAILEKIVLESIGKDHHGNSFPANNKTINEVTFNQLKESHKIFLNGNFKEYFSKLLQHYKNTITKYKEYRVSGLPSKIHQTDYDEFKKYCNQLLDEKNLAYLRLVAEISPKGIEIISSGINSFYERLRFHGGFPEADASINDTVFSDLMFNTAFKLRGIDDKEHCYLFDHLVINENKQKLLEEWPSVLLLNNNKIEKRYFKQILTKLNQFYK